MPTEQVAHNVFGLPPPSGFRLVLPDGRKLRGWLPAEHIAPFLAWINDPAQMEDYEIRYNDVVVSRMAKGDNVQQYVGSRLEYDDAAD